MAPPILNPSGTPADHQPTILLKAKQLYAAVMNEDSPVGKVAIAGVEIAKYSFGGAAYVIGIALSTPFLIGGLGLAMGLWPLTFLDKVVTHLSNKAAEAKRPNLALLLGLASIPPKLAIGLIGLPLWLMSIAPGALADLGLSTALNLDSKDLNRHIVQNMNSVFIKMLFSGVAKRLELWVSTADLWTIGSVIKDPNRRAEILSKNLINSLMRYTIKPEDSQSGSDVATIFFGAETIIKGLDSMIEFSNSKGLTNQKDILTTAKKKFIDKVLDEVAGKKDGYKIGFDYYNYRYNGADLLDMKIDGDTTFEGKLKVFWPENSKSTEEFVPEVTEEELEDIPSRQTSQGASE
jgi:hypothetical protein